MVVNWLILIFMNSEVFCNFQVVKLEVNHFFPHIFFLLGRGEIHFAVKQTCKPCWCQNKNLSTQNVPKRMRSHKAEILVHQQQTKTMKTTINDT